MLKKICPHCKSASFSSTTLGEPWLCPRCEKDISHVPIEPPEISPHRDEPPEPRSTWWASFKDYFSK